MCPFNPPASHIGADSLGLFPGGSGDNLNGKHFDLPGAFEGALNLVVVAFQREQQHDVDGWTSRGSDIQACRASVRGTDRDRRWRARHRQSPPWKDNWELPRVPAATKFVQSGPTSSVQIAGVV
jgi:hypothetical protein